MVNREYRTDIYVSRAGREQRRALRQTPRKRIEYVMAQTEGCLREFDRSMVSAQRTLLAIPERVRFVTLGSGIAGGGTTVAISPVPTWIQEGASLILVAPDRYGLRTVDSVVGTIVIFEESDAEAWPADTRLHPSLEGYLDANIAAPVVDARGIVEASVVFHVDPGSETEEAAGSADTVLNGREVFLIRPDRWQPIDLGRVQEGVGQVDYGFGRVKRFFPIEFSTRMWEAQYTRCNAEHAETIRQFFARMKGMRDEFYMPTWQEDLVPVSGLTAAGVTITVEGTETDTVYSDDTVFRAIAVKHSDGSWLLRAVSSIAPSGGNSVLTVSEAWGQTVPLSDIAMVCWLPVWRFATDILSMSWPRDDVAQVSLAFQMIENLTFEVETEDDDDEEPEPDDPPIITSPDTISITEGSELAHSLTADKDVVWALTGGADASLFEIDGSVLKLFNDAVGVTGVYEVIVTAFDSGDPLLFDTQTITVTVTTISATLPGTPSLSLAVASESEIIVTTSATNAVSYEYELDDSDSWVVLPPSNVIAGLSDNTLFSIKTRGIGSDGLSGPESSADTETTNVTPAAYVPAKFRYDGLTSYLLRGAVPTGLVDGKAFIFHVVLTFEGNDGIAQRIFSNGGNNFSFRKNAANKLEIYGQNAAGDPVLQGITAQTYGAASGRLVIEVHVDTATQTLEIYVNDKPAVLSTTIVELDAIIDMANANWSIGAATNGNSKAKAIVEEFFFHDISFDISDLINRRKFIGPDGNPRDLGADGSVPLGVQPLIYMRTGSAPGTNSGDGGNFTVNGTIEWVNDTVEVVGFPSEQADHFVEFFSVQTHVERTSSTHNAGNNESDWSSTAWRQKFIDLGVRHSRSKIGRSALSKAHIHALYAANGVRFITNVSSYNDVDGTLATSQTAANLAFLENEVGLEKIFAIEGPNEYTYDKKFWKTISSITPVNTTTNLITTTTAHGFSVGQRVVFNWEATGTLPAPITTAGGRNYYIISDGFTATAFKISLTQGGSAVDITSAGSGVREVSNWVQRVRDIQAYIWNYINSRPAWNNVKVIVPSLWRRFVQDYQALGDLSAISDYGHLHYYQGNRKPSRYNKTEDGTGDNPMEEAITDAQIMRPNSLVYIGESGFDYATQVDPTTFPEGAYSGNVDQAVTINLTTDVFTTAVAHGLLANNKVYFVTTGSLTGISVLPQLYFVISSGLTATDFKVSATQGGSSVNVTAQSGTHRVGYAYRWSGDLATPDIVSKHIGREWAEFWYRRTSPGVLKHNYYVFMDDHRTNHYGLINRHSYGGTWEERNNYWTVRNIIALMDDPGADFVTTQMDFSIDLSASPDLRWRLFKKRNGRFYIMIWNDVTVWRRTSPFGEITNARVNVPFQVNAPSFTSMRTWEPTMLQSRGDSPSSGLTHLSTNGSPMDPQVFSVPDHLQFHEFIP